MRTVGVFYLLFLFGPVFAFNFEHISWVTAATADISVWQRRLHGISFWFIVLLGSTLKRGLGLQDKF